MSFLSQLLLRLTASARRSKFDMVARSLVFRQPREREQTELSLIGDVESADDPTFIFPRPSKIEKKRRTVHIAVV